MMHGTYSTNEYRTVYFTLYSSVRIFMFSVLSKKFNLAKLTSIFKISFDLLICVLLFCSVG
jgi:hypothetical protein